MRAPTEKQMAFVETITKVLDIEFPQSSHDFKRKIYAHFIKEHYEEFKEAMEMNDWTDEDEMAWFQMLNG